MSSYVVCFLIAYIFCHHSYLSFVLGAPLSPPESRQRANISMTLIVISLISILYAKVYIIYVNIVGVEIVMSKSLPLESFLIA